MPEETSKNASQSFKERCSLLKEMAINPVMKNETALIIAGVEVSKYLTA